MDCASLCDLIKCIEYGNKLHIGVIMLSNQMNEKMLLPLEMKIHASAICSEIKEMNGGYQTCYACRNAAIEKVLATKSSSYGLCIHGVYEYMQPVLFRDEVIAIIFVGNILTDRGRERLMNISEALPLDTMEINCDLQKCVEISNLIEGYIQILLEKYGSNLKNPVIDHIKSYIAENMENDISVVELSQRFGYNEAYLGRLFKTETGYAIREYVNRERIKKAKSRLLTGESVIEIAQSVGFNNVTYFNKIFKQQVGTTPTQYRKAHNATKQETW
ncbi:MAG: helix-turn-helix domain-containing protein [Ruminococcaceae bacterium]|nr:helix-turn-helix domain-containing protein [Oscillospiraceae bacterium]